MDNCITELFELTKKLYPYHPSGPSEKMVSERLEKAIEKLKDVPEEYKHAVFVLRDSADTLSHYRARHSFTLGLDVGLSISRELLPFQEER